MKKLSIVIILVWCMCGTINAIVPNAVEIIPIPKVPKASEVTIDYTNIYENKYNEINKFEYKWGNNNLYVYFSDLFYYNNAVFNADGRLIYYISEWKESPGTYVAINVYNYDERGLLTSIENPYNSYKRNTEIFYNSEEKIDSILVWEYEDLLDSWYKIDKSEYFYSTDYYDRKYYTFQNDINQYKYWGTTRYYLDEYGRVIKFGDIDRSGGDTYEFEYNDTGYTQYITSPNASYASIRYDYTFNEYGDYESIYYYEWLNGSYWKPCIINLYSYKYLNSGVREINNTQSVYEKIGEKIIINSEEEYFLYDLNGILISHGFGKQSIDIKKKGIYLLISGKTIYKIIV